MPTIVWDNIADRVYESGLDRGVLYLPDGTAVPWNGLISVIEKNNNTVSPIYYDGKKINDFVLLGDFSATMRALTYPDEFEEFEGWGEMREGLLISGQKPKTFGLCYRTKKSNMAEGEIGYKIHLLYNVTAIPREVTRETLSLDTNPSVFEWDIYAIPEEIDGFFPTAHFVIDSTALDPWLLDEIEEMFYGGEAVVATLVPLQDLANYISEWFRVKIVDNGDGTWTAITLRDGLIVFDETDLFRISNANVVYLDETTFVLSDTLELADIPQIEIIDHGDGTWTAIGNNELLTVVDEDGLFEIRNATASYLGSETYSLSDTVAS